MDMKIKTPELKCMDPENYQKYFRALCWSGTKKTDKKQPRRFNKRDRLKKLKGSSALAICYAPALLANPSQFAVFATVRRTILSRCRRLQNAPLDLSDESDNEEVVPPANVTKLSKITIIGLRTVFTLISQARYTDAHLCEQTLKALLDVLQGHPPEDLSHEPHEIMSNLHGLLVEISGSSWPTGRMDSPSKITAISSSCLIALAVARGEAELILGAAASLIISSPALTEQYIQIPTNLTTLQRSVQSVILGPPSRNLWLHFGVPDKSLVRSFTVDLPTHLSKGAGLIVRSLVSDGCYLYLFTSKGLIKIGSGYGSSIRQHVYLHKYDFFGCDRHSWLGYCKNKLYVRIGRKRTELHEVNKDTLEIKSIIRLDPGQCAVAESKCLVFTDSNWLGLIILNSPDSLNIKMYDAEATFAERAHGGKHTLIARREFTVHLLRRRTLVLGRPSFDDGLSRRMVDIDSPVAVQLDDNDDDPLSAVCAGQDFGLLITSSGKVYYTGKGSSLGYKAPSPQTGRWTLMKETLFTRNEAPNIKRCRVTQIALGHEGVHAILVLDNGSALFTGIARRGEDGDANKHRRTPKPTRPKKILRADRHYIIYAACNYGSTALVTRQGELLMFGKDTQHCDESGLVTGLRHEKVTQVALGKAHAITLTTFGEVYSFGINNKGQCGREFGYTKEKFGPNRNTGKEEARLCPGGAHSWSVEYCRVCVMCRECTGFASACHCSALPNRFPGEHCGCGEGDSGCSVCGVCQRCADASGSTTVTKADLILANERLQCQLESSNSSSASGLESGSNQQPQALGSGLEFEREASVKVNCLSPGRVIVPGGHRIMAVACGLHHSVLLSEHGEVFTFGSNQWGALGAGDIANHHRIVRVRVPRALSVAAGSNHTVILTREGEIYTFGSFQKGSLGRARQDNRQEPLRADRNHLWYAVPGRVPRIGPRYGCRAVWICASGDQTFVQVTQALVKTESLYSATITANSNSIIILPNQPEHNFKCITINKNDGSCTSWTGPEQVDFVNSLACLDPMYDVLWCFQPQARLMKCYNIIAFDSHKLQRCCVNDPEAFADPEFDYPYYGSMKRLEDIRYVESFEWITNNESTAENTAPSNMSILNQELAIPCTSGFQVTRIHAALHLLGCVDSLTYAYDNKPAFVDCKRHNNIVPVTPVVEDYLTVNRFENHGGGWGYTGHSVEAIRFMCDSDILLGGVGLYGGRGEYNAKIRLYDIGPDGCDQEPDGEMVYETDDVFYECAPNDKYPLMFETPFPVVATKWYVVAASINGPSSDCGSSGQPMITNDDITFHFKTSKKSNNGTDINAGQIPSLLYNTMGPNYPSTFRHVDLGEPVVVLSRNLSRKVTVSCFRSLITLLHWSWKTFRDILLNTNGLVPLNYHKLTVMKHQKRLVYVIRSALRIVKSYIIEVYPQYVRKKNTPEYMSYFDSIVEVRNFVQAVMAEPTPNCTSVLRTQGRYKTHKMCYVQFALDLTNCILKETHEIFIACFYAFFPTPTLKWNHLCFMLYHVRNGSVPESQVLELTATCAAMCHSQSLRDVLQYIVPFTQSHTVLQEARRPDSKVKEVPSKSATVPRSSHAQKPPPVPPRAKDPQRSNGNEEKLSHLEWHLLDIVPRLLDVVLNPILEKLTPVQCPASHDHGEIKKQERLAEFCCKLIARIIAEMSSSPIQYPKDDVDESTIKQLVTASRFMRVNTVRTWRTGYGSPDAICITVDRPGVNLCGACVFVGNGRYNYSIELLQDMRTSSEEANPTHCWVSCQTSEGSFSSTEANYEMVQVKFARPITLRDDTRYALRFCCEGMRTASGDCGLPAVTGPDGTTFQFSSCSLSFNGTTLARGQLPCLIYYRTKWHSSSNEGVPGTSAAGTSAEPYSSDNAEDLEWERGTAREAAIAVAMHVTEKCGALLAAYRTLPPDELRRAVPLLVASPALNTLMPHALANLEELSDSKSVIHILEMVHKLLPHVAAINHEMPSVDDIPTTITTSQYYTWVESDHPYKPSTVLNKRVLFPPSVSWIVLEMDPRSITAQPEDTLTVYAVAGAPKHRCHCINEARVPDPPIRKSLIHLTSESREAEELDETCTDAPCMHYNCTYVSVTPKLCNFPIDRPQQSLLVPGNEVVFSLETASDYLHEFNRSNMEECRFGFRCLCVGYEVAPFTNIKTGGTLGGLVNLEMELVHLGASCAAHLLTPDLDVPPLTHGTIMDVQMQAMLASGAGAGSEDVILDETESLLLSRGLELGSPPTVHSVLDGLPLLRYVKSVNSHSANVVDYGLIPLVLNGGPCPAVGQSRELNKYKLSDPLLCLSPRCKSGSDIRSISTERQFLSDFVAGEESTAGGRLARWLAPGPRVEPSRCELKPPLLPARPAARLSLPIILRDQYGDIVCSPAIKIEVVVQRIENSILRAGKGLASACGGSISNVPYQPTVQDTMWFHAITMMKPYQNYSFEELRFASGAWGGVGSFLEGLGGGGRIPAERIPVDAHRDGSYSATWMPRTPGTYMFRCTLDDYPTAQDLKIDVEEYKTEDLAERWLGSVARHRLRRYLGEDSAGLRVRAGPSLQAETIGRIPPGAYIAIVDEVANKDGTWVRLSIESAHTYADGCTGAAWCLQYHGHLDRRLLLTVDDLESQDEFVANWNASNESQTDVPQWLEDDADAANNDLSLDDRRFPFSIQCDLESESDSSSSPYVYGEPSKRSRRQRNESTSMPTPRRVPRNNGNSEELSPVKCHSSDDLRELDFVPETDILGTQETLPTRVAQTGTQTSPESTNDDIANSQFEVPKGDSHGFKRLSRDRFMRPRSRLSGSPPPPARSIKYAHSPAQGECLRSVFAALLWHEGIVHDAIACATFLKFHPQLPKAGARVVTRPPHDTPPSRPQRHSVEVFNTGQHLHIHPSTLETLTRSGIEASTSRAHKTDVDMEIREEEAGPSSAPDFPDPIAGPSFSVVNVLPPALRALVALWDVLNDADQLSAATDKNRKNIVEKNENDDSKLSNVRKKKENRAPRVVSCELCGGRDVPPPLAAHMRNAHPGCKALSNRGYDRAGKYKQADSLSNEDNPLSECGQLAQDLIGVKIRATLVAYQLWYIYCEKCRERSLKATAEQRQGEREPIFEGTTPDLDHQTMRDNAVFLLDLAPLINSESSTSSGWRDSSGRSPPTPPGSMWQPAPPFQCLPALGAAPKPMSDAARYHSLGRPLPATIEELPSTSGASGAQTSRVPRSVSMGQAGGRDLAHAAWPPIIHIETESQETLSGNISRLSLLTQPSAALQKLVGGVEWSSEACAVTAFETPPIDSEALMRSPVLEFILAKRELPACRQKMDAAVRINTIRQYAFEAFNWLLRSTTQPTSVHDVMWWFCNAIDKFARIVPMSLTLEDYKENVVNDWSRYAAPAASTAAICPGGRAAGGARAAFHAFLGSVSALAPSLPPASAAALQAVRCWALHYSQHDRTFLHRSQVFSVISKILSHNEDDIYEEGMAGALHESYQSYISKPNFIHTCPDVTGWCEVTVSSRTGMAGSLTDGSTETFWESGDEDRNRAKWIQITYARPSHQEKPHIICIFVDNTRDTMNKTLLMSFLYAGGTSDLTHMQDIEVDPKVATWVTYTLPKANCSSVRVRCELRGPEPAVRVRQIRALGAPSRTPNPYPYHPLHALTERDTLRVFRLLTKQVFGKLLDWGEYSSSESGEGVVVEEAAGDDSDLREHVVGILFAGHKLTSLQRQVMSHIVCSIGCETSRVRDDWETALICAETLEQNGDDLPREIVHHQQDNYCFEILSLLLALSGSAVGRNHLAQRTELLADLLSLLHTGSERVQRQVISLIRRIIAEVPPQKILAALNYAGDVTTSVTLLDHLLCYVGKALSVQVKVKGGGATSPGTVTLGSSVTPAPPAAWFMRGDTTKRHAYSVAKLITDMAEDKISEAWGVETRNALVQYLRAVAQVEDTERRPQRCVSLPVVWLALAALCVCDPQYMDFVNGPNEGESRSREGMPEARALCANHDDGTTAAVIDCRTCGTLCSECDRFLHLKRAARNHQRKICKEEESAIRLDIHEGCGRAKLHWLLLLVDRRTLKALMEFRGLEGTGNMTSDVDGGVVLSGTCRFCGARGNTGLLAIGNVCADQQCQEHSRDACNRVLSCGHTCGGVRGERACLPCLFGCASAETLRQDADDMCMICFTDPLQAAPAIQLGCGHVFHFTCCKKVLTNKWVGPRITFSFSQCPICKENISHWSLEELLEPIRALREEVSRKALMRLEYEGMAAGASHSRAHDDPATYAMERYAYYVCHKCGKAYFGGLARCEAESNGAWEPAELVCGACSDVAGARMCPKHGVDFLEYKCRYCCSVAVFFCFGTSHFCNACHDDFQRVTNLSRHLLPQCPAGPKGIQLPGSSDECPLHVQHPPTGEEFALGCGICRHAHSF